jgi:hypothetical protein
MLLADRACRLIEQQRYRLVPLGRPSESSARPVAWAGSPTRGTAASPGRVGRLAVAMRPMLVDPLNRLGERGAFPPKERWHESPSGGVQTPTVPYACPSERRASRMSISRST